MDRWFFRGWGKLLIQTPLVAWVALVLSLLALGFAIAAFVRSRKKLGKSIKDAAGDYSNYF